MAKETPSTVVNLLCEGTMVEGDIKTKNDIRIDGAVKGKIITSSRLVLGNSANIEGNIECVNVDVMGTVNGDILGTGTVYCGGSHFHRAGRGVRRHMPDVE